MSQDKYTLPFEIMKGESESKKKSAAEGGVTSKKTIQAGLKRIEVFANSQRAAEVLAAIKEKGFEATSYDSKGYGEQRDKVRTGRGIGEASLSYSTRRTIVTIIDSDKLEEVVNAVKSSIGGGVIAISPMDALIHV